MNNITIYIGDDLLDVSPKTKVALTYQTGGVGDIRSRTVSRTNSFQVDKTENNVRIFGFASDVKSSTVIPYRRINSRILIDGLQVLSGYAYLKETSDTFEISIYETVIDFYTRIDGLTLRDLDFGDTPITWNAAYIDSTRNATSGIVSPVIQYGQIDSTLANAEIGDIYLPSVYLHTIIAAIFDNAGYTISGDILTDENYLSVIMPYSWNDWPGTSFTMAMIMPEVSQVDTIKNFLMMFGLILVENNGDIQIKSFEFILTNVADAYDWTEKRHTGVADKITYIFPGYAQKNYFRWADVTSREDASFTYSNSGFLEIDNENISTETEIFTSEFGIGEDGFDGNSSLDVVNGCVIPVWTSIPTNYPETEPFDEEPVARLALVRARVSGEPAFLYDGNSRTDYLVGYFSNQSPTNKTLRWDDADASTDGLLSVNYDKLQATISRAKMLERFYNLSLVDVSSLVIYNLIYDDGDYFYIHKIDNFVTGKLTKVILLKIEGYEIDHDPVTYMLTPGTGEVIFEGFRPLVSILT